MAPLSFIIIVATVTIIIGYQATEQEAELSASLTTAPS